MQIGTDIIEIKRIKLSIEKFTSRFLNRIYTPQEIDYCEAKKAQKYASYAARFAAKEAFSKALGSGFIENIKWTDIEVSNKQSGQPFFILHGPLAAKLNEQTTKLSLSHNRTQALAFVVIS
jgi:holo-[acyl-carrier protein] synthase